MQINKDIIIEFNCFNRKTIIKKTITGLSNKEFQTNCLEASSLIFDRISKMILSNELFKSSYSYLCNWSYNMVLRYPPIIIGDPQIELTFVIQPKQIGKTTIVKTITGNERDLGLSILKALEDIKEEIQLIPQTKDLLTESKYKFLVFERESLEMLINLLFQYYQQLQKDDRVYAYSPNEIIVRIKDENTKSFRNSNIFDKNLKINEFERYERIENINAKKISVNVSECIFVKNINNFSTAIVFEQNCMVLALSVYDKKNGSSCKSKFTFSIKNLEESFNIADNVSKSIVIKLDKK